VIEPNELEDRVLRDTLIILVLSPIWLPQLATRIVRGWLADRRARRG
jgi:hypothetical protein